MNARRLRILATVALAVTVLIGGTAASVQGAPPSPPALTVTPHTALADLQTVTVTGAHFSPGVSVATLECAPSATGPEGCDLGTLAYATADGSGAFTTTRPVRRLVSLGGQQVDCATSTCALVAANIANYLEHALVDLGFDPSKPPVVPKVTVTPTTKLVDHQLVTVGGTGFAPGTDLSIFECLAGPVQQPPGPPDPFGSCDTSAQRTVVVGPTDTFTARNVPVQRILSTFGPTGPVTTDCASAAGKCVLRVLENSFEPGSSFDRPLSFDPAKPPAARAVTVTPTTGLTDHQLVTVHGAGYVPGVPVEVLECTSAPVAGFCDYGHVRSATPGLGGAFTVSIAVQRFIPTFTSVAIGGTPQKTDCAARAGACAITVSGQNDFGTVGPQRALTFLSRPAVRSSLHVQPHDHLRDNQIVRVAGAGFTPLQPVQVVECTDTAVATASADLSQCDATTIVVTTADRAGTFTADLAIHDVIGGSGVLAPCGTRHCVLLAVGSGQFVGYPGGFVTSGPVTSLAAGAAPVTGGVQSFAAPRHTQTLTPSRAEAESHSTHPDLPYAVLVFGAGGH